VQDEAELRGHRKTYVGSMPGKIIQALKKVKKGNPIILLDEVDKMGMGSFRGDPTSALLEILDPEQNHTFQDHYIELDYDLSSVLFICTANSTHNLKGPLLDRMELISIEGYIEEEKINIAQRHLIPRQMERHGLKDYSLDLSDSLLKEIIAYYTREAGVRQLERTLSSVFRKFAKIIVTEKDEDTASKKSVSKRSKKLHLKDKKQLEGMLGPRKFRFTGLETNSMVGLTNGLAWTETGGDTLAVETLVFPGTGKYTLTGQLGDVMKESCSAGLSFVRSLSPLFNLDSKYFKNHDFHIHVPEGAIPKDGPSAGVAIITSLVSAILRIPVRNTVAMTGEITLRGRVLPIGGLKEKTLAAHRAHIKTVIFPKDNEKDLKDVPKQVLKDIKLVPVEQVDQVLITALEMDSADKIFKNLDKTWHKRLAISKKASSSIHPS
ncbi:MAG: AAA family ATPase, partial [Oligoflexia bacterium]|nr:AAA family ATPase [Oligoflexia bacterium]